MIQTQTQTVQRFLQWVWITDELLADTLAFESAKKFIVDGIDSKLKERGYVRVGDAEFKESRPWDAYETRYDEKREKRFSVIARCVKEAV